jgi:hypothetical protein
MSKYSELADRLEDSPTIDVGEMELLDSAATALRELEAENERLESDNEALNKKLVYQMMLTEEARNVGMVEGDAAETRIAELEAENKRVNADWEIVIEERDEAEAERDSLRKTLERLEYWFDIDQEVRDSMRKSEVENFDRQLARIRSALEGK